MHTESQLGKTSQWQNLVIVMEILWIAVFLATSLQLWYIGRLQKQQTITTGHTKRQSVKIALTLNLLVAFLRVLYFVDPCGWNGRYPDIVFLVLHRMSTCTVISQWLLMLHRWWELGQLRSTNGFLQLIDGVTSNSWIAVVVTNIVLCVIVVALTVAQVQTHSGMVDDITNILIGLSTLITCLLALFASRQAIDCLVALGKEYQIAIRDQNHLSIHLRKAIQILLTVVLGTIFSICSLGVTFWKEYSFDSSSPSSTFSGASLQKRNHAEFVYYVIRFVCEYLMCVLMLFASISPPPFLRAMELMVKISKHFRRFSSRVAMIVGGVIYVLVAVVMFGVPLVDLNTFGEIDIRVFHFVLHEACLAHLFTGAMFLTTAFGSPHVTRSNIQSALMASLACSIGVFSLAAAYDSEAIVNKRVLMSVSAVHLVVAFCLWLAKSDEVEDALQQQHVQVELQQQQQQQNRGERRNIAAVAQ